jgi:hypothetical protein
MDIKMFSPDGKIYSVNGQLCVDGAFSWVEFTDGEGVEMIATGFPLLYPKPVVANGDGPSVPGPKDNADNPKPPKPKKKSDGK